MKNITHYILAIFFFFLASVLIAHFSFAAEMAEEQEWQKLVELVEEAYFLAQKNQFEASKKQLQQLSAHFLTLESGQYLQNIEQVRVLTETIVQAEQALNAVQINPEQVERGILKLQLALDAVSHKKQPLWLNYYPTIVDTMDQLFVSLKQDDRDSFYHHVNRLVNAYEFIRPSLVISHDVSTINKLDSQLRHLLSQSGNLWSKPKKAEAFLTSLNEDWRNIFFKTKNEGTSSFIYMLVGMASFIITVLSYVAWRKYRGEKEIKKVVWKK